VLIENRRWLRVYQEQVLKEVGLQRTAAGWECSAEMSRTAGGLSYAEMIEAAEKASFRRALWQIAETVADLFGRMVPLVAPLREMPDEPEPSWAELSERWGGSS